MGRFLGWEGAQRIDVILHMSTSKGQKCQYFPGAQIHAGALLFSVVRGVITPLPPPLKPLDPN